MRVGIYTHYLDKFPKSAPSLYQIELIEHLNKFRDLEIVLIHHKKNPSIPIYSKYEEVIIPKSPYLGEHYINKLGLDIIHFNAIPWSWRSFVHKINSKRVATVHGDIWWVEPQLGYNKLTEKVKRIIEPLVTHQLDKIFAVSYSIRNTLIRQIKADPRKIKVVYPGINPSLFYPRPEKEINNMLKRYNITPPYILHVSNYSPIKNPKVLFKTFRIVHKNIKDIKLVIVGAGWKEYFYKNLINKYPDIEKHIVFIGWIKKENLPPIYSGAKVFFSPSYHETFGFPLVEAMACGTPVIASQKYSIPEVVGTAGLLHPPNNPKQFATAILSVVENPALRKKLSKKGILRAHNFTWEKAAAIVYYTYKELLRND